MFKLFAGFQEIHHSVNVWWVQIWMSLPQQATKLCAILQNSNDQEYLGDKDEEDSGEINVKTGDEINNETEATALQGKEDSEKE